LNRPAEQRIREFKYRFAQSLVFGLPVLVLQWFGHSLGGAPGEADRWVPLLQALLAGWVAYVAATGMLVEGVLAVWAGKITITLADAVVALFAILLYLFSVISVLGIFIHGELLYRPLLFHFVVLILLLWCGVRWVSMKRAG
jgi:hypothetical protein